MTEHRLKQIVSLYNKLGDELRVANAEGMKASSVERALREAKSKGLFTKDCEPEHIPIKLPKIFIFDLENAPSKAAVWGMWKQNISTNQITEGWYMLSWSGKWLFGNETYSDVLTPEEAKEGNDKRIMESLWQFIDDADILLGHNILGFDIQKMNTRFVINGLIPPSPYQAIDTLYSARKQFSFTSNKLDYLCKQFGVTRKADNGGMERWLGCCEGNPEDLIDMEKYNRQDIAATEELYIAMRAYIKTHPNLGLYMDSEDQLCYKCGSNQIEWMYDDLGQLKCYVTTMNQYHAYRCKDCTSVGRSRFSRFNKENKKHLTSPIAR